MLTLVLGLVAIVLLGVIIWRVTSAPGKKTTDAIDIAAGSVSGKDQSTFTGSIPRSFNQSQGATFTYTGWLLVNDFTLNYGRKRVIF
jgi:hypothetical protein